MKRKRVVQLALLATVVLLGVASAMTWRSLAAPPDGEQGGLGALSGSPSARAAAAAPAAPVPGGPGFYAQSSLHFRPYLPLYEYDYAGTDLYNPGTGTGYYEAPLALPNGATITKLVVYYWDNSATLDLTGQLYRVAFDGTGAAPMAVVSSSGYSAVYSYAETASIVNPVVDQQSYSYLLELTLPPSLDLRLVGMRIDYAYAVSLPIMMKQ